MLEKLYAYKAKYESEVAEHEKALVLAKAKVSVVDDMIADAEAQTPIEAPLTNDSY
jgi:hypothetical protein